MSSAARPTEPEDDRPHTGWTAVRFRWWNLLLLVPLIAILPPLFNSETPALGGLPFFYWFQIAIIPLGVACTVAVHLMTRSPDEEAGAVDDRDAADGVQR